MTSSLRRHAIPRFAGDVLAPGDPGYDVARRVEDDAVDRSPALIARCAGPDDVAAALRHARAAGLPVTVRGGGHGPDGFAVADGALMLDLRGLDTIAVDPARRIARAGGGADVARARPGDAGARPGDHRRADSVGRRRRLHARLRLGLAGAQARARGGLPALRAGRHGRR